MLKLGDYDEEIARQIKRSLDDAKLKVEIKMALSSTIETEFFVEGKLSELRGEVKSFERYEQYLHELKEVLPKAASPEDFKEQFLKQIDPTWNENRDRLAKIIERRSAPTSEDAGNDKDEFLHLMVSMIRDAVAFEFVERAVSLNNLEMGVPVEDKLDDPKLSIEVNPDDYTSDHKLLKRKANAYFSKEAALYVDELSSPLIYNVDEEFSSLYPDEYLKLMLLAILIEDLFEPPSSGKMEMEEFIERCFLDLEEGGEFLSIDGRDAAEEIARALEKHGILKIKGDKVKWRR